MKAAHTAAEVLKQTQDVQTARNTLNRRYQDTS